MAERALPYAVEQAERFRSELILLRAVGSSLNGNGLSPVELGWVQDQMGEWARDYLVSIATITLLLVLPLGCTPAVPGQLSQEQQVDALKATVEQLAGRLAAQESLADSATEDRLALQVQIGELARRIAEDEFDRINGEEKGLLNFDAALQLCLKAIEQQPDPSYPLEDIVFLPDFASFQPASHAGPVWQFTVRGPSGRFIVIINASSGGLVFVSKVGAAE
jgi:hypothetical protein